MTQPTSTTATLHPRPSPPNLPTTARSNALPSVLQTPAGLALLELQGTINLPTTGEEAAPSCIHIGRIDFPDYRPDSLTFDPSSNAWMRRVYLFVGQHQRLTGEVKKLPKALGIVRRRRPQQQQQQQQLGGGYGEQEEEEEEEEELEVVEVVKYKIVFSSRPEPVGTA